MMGEVFSVLPVGWEQLDKTLTNSVSDIQVRVTDTRARTRTREHTRNPLQITIHE